MKNARAILFLLAGIFALVVAHVLLSRSGASTHRVRRTTLCTSLENVDAISWLRPRMGEIRLVRENDVWHFARPFTGLADRALVLRFLDALTQAPVEDSISDAEILGLGRSRADFELDEPRLSLLVSSGAKTNRFSFGMITPSGKGVYAAVEGQNSVYVLSTNAYAALNLDADNLRHRSLFTSDLAAITAFEIKRPAGNLVRFIRDGETWKSQDRAASQPEIARFLHTLVSTRAASFEWPKGQTNEADNASAALLAVYGLDPQSALAVSLICSDGVDRRVSFGLDAGKDFVYALAQDGNAIVTVPASLADAAERGSHAFVDTRLLPLEASAVQSYSLTQDDVTCLVARGKDGAWRLDAPIAAPADSAFAAIVLEKLLALSTADVVPSGITVSIATNLPTVVVSAARIFGEGRMEDLRARDLLSIDPALVKRIVSTPQEKSPTSVVYVPDRRQWQIEVNTADASGKMPVADAKAIAAMLTALNPLRAARIEKLMVSAADLSRYGLAQPALTIAIDQTRENAVRRNILIGAQAPGGRYATVGSSDAVFVLPDETVRILSAALVEK